MDIRKINGNTTGRIFLDSRHFDLLRKIVEDYFKNIDYPSIILLIIKNWKTIDYSDTSQENRFRINRFLNTFNSKRKPLPEKLIVFFPNLQQDDPSLPDNFKYQGVDIMVYGLTQEIVNTLSHQDCIYFEEQVKLLLEKIKEDLKECLGIEG